MQLDEQTRRKIEQLTGKNVPGLGRVNSLLEVSPGALELAVHLASLHGGSIPAIQYLRHMSRCTLAEAIDFLNGVRLANGQ
ncbi:hypothetical protein IV454_21095 [Massilia antarctica]|uniref:Uncharacterized protein n=1 Tax=Massilia antarctica TaxID=2765360 RepID=A0AA48WAQ2_9BURK|nr:hypothetical protein [Massilia antarctica]QPI48039.1 hypothetical protein IV454_21095 [Massilia antarctica]